MATIFVEKAVAKFILGPSSTATVPLELIGFADTLSGIKPSANSCLRTESSLESKGSEVSTLKQYSRFSFLFKKKCNMSLTLS